MHALYDRYLDWLWKDMKAVPLGKRLNFEDRVNRLAAQCEIPVCGGRDT